MNKKNIYLLTLIIIVAFGLGFSNFSKAEELGIPDPDENISPTTARVWCSFVVSKTGDTPDITDGYNVIEVYDSTACTKLCSDTDAYSKCQAFPTKEAAEKRGKQDMEKSNQDMKNPGTSTPTSPTGSGSGTASTQYTPMEKIPGTANATDFVSYIKAVYKFGIWTIGIAAMLMIMVGGFMYITSAGNNAAMGKAKSYITDALIGLVMAMSAYLLLYTINPDLVNISIKFPSGTGSGSGAGLSAEQLAKNKEECEKYCKDGGVVNGSTDTTSCFNNCMAEKAKQQSPTGDPDQYKPSGKCNPATAGPCTPENLQSTFGSQAQQASIVCAFESSGGNPGKASGTDVCKDGKPFSWGLFQINLTQHQLNGLNCPSAFNGRNNSCTVVNQELYNQCVTAAKDPNINISKAKQIFDGRPNWEDWRNTRNACLSK